MVAALLLGATGTATASGLTRSAVKKIATKVVKKQAAGLSVAHAETAGTAANAQALAGKPSTSYQDDVIRYTLTSTTASNSKSFLITGLAAGSYHMEWHLVASAATSNTATDCRILATGSPTEYGFSYGTFLGGSSTNHGGALVPIVSGGTATLACNAASNITLFGGTFPSYVLVTPVDTVTDRAMALRPAEDPVAPGQPATNAR